MKHWKVLAVASLVVTGLADLAAGQPRVVQPAGAGPHPVVLLISGCSGFVAFNGVNLYEERAKEWSEAGYLAVFVDYLAKRGFKTCAGNIDHATVGKDAIEAAAWVRTQPNVDRSRIFAIGWSYGGGGILSVLASLPAGDTTVTRAVAVYPDCSGARPLSAGTPTLMLLAALDEVAPPSGCEPVLAAGKPDRLKVVTYQNARHGFDQRGLREKETYHFGTIGYSAEADRASQAEIRAFLK